MKTRNLKLSTLEEFELYRAALELGLTEPIVIESRADLKSESGWRDKVEPYQHQIANLISFCRRLPVTLLSDDVGLGKTISAGLIASELMSRGRVSKIMIVCPKLIMQQWKEELKDKFNILSTEATGNQLLTATPPNDKGAIITTYNTARMHLEAVVNKGFDLLIIDEAHKLRNLHGTDSAPKVAEMFKKVLANRDFKYVLMLTATPIQNRLWDLYSLVDLLAVARGHTNPFGTKGMFARHFIADDNDKARQLNLDKRDEFRSIVYSHMSRTRRGDAKLSFPERIVKKHFVRPTKEELDLIRLISEPIQELDAWSQMSVARAAISSPHALAAELKSRAESGAIPMSLAEEVRKIANAIPTTSKQMGLEALVNELRKENPTDWRMVVFTTRRETQTTIEDFLLKKGISCATINGQSSARNPETLAKFKQSPPGVHVIVSTEAGSEGVNLQAANVIVNYDLPWNPMVVEQRIGRVQRLASKHANVCIFNMILQGTFEEFVVGRLMEKLLLASHAIGDIEALLGTAGIEDDDSETFEEKVRKIVVDILAGKNVQEALRLEEESIEKAKAQLAESEKNINELLGGSDGYEYKGPRCPKLPKQKRSLDIKTFTERAVEKLGGKLVSNGGNTYSIELDGKSKSITINEDATGDNFNQSFGPGDPEFERILTRIESNGLHLVNDEDRELAAKLDKLAREWVGSFNGSFERTKIEKITPCFVGTAFVRARVHVAHDSYERIVEVSCNPTEMGDYELDNLEALPHFISYCEKLGVSPDYVIEQVNKEEGIAEFNRFYIERLAEELKMAGESERLRRKIEDDFTPRLQAKLVGFSGQFYRKLEVSVSYKIGSEDIYQTWLTVVPSKNELTAKSDMETCEVSAQSLPVDCLGKCSVSSKAVIKHYLRASDFSGRLAISEHLVTCALSGKQLLADEMQKSFVTGNLVDPRQLKKSEISGQVAEPEHLDSCAFTGIAALKSELVESQISGKKYRSDQKRESVLSGKSGHWSEFVQCEETSQTISATEAAICEVTGKRVTPSELVKCGVTGKKAIKSVCVASEVSKDWILKSSATRSELSGKFAEPEHFSNCMFTNSRCLNNELVVSELSGKKLRVDQQKRSVVSGKIGHSTEFISCAETNHALAASEAERCSITHKDVVPGILETCEVTGKRVLPSELIKCAATGKKAIRSVCVNSSVSGALIIEKHSILSSTGRHCAPSEGVICVWSTEKFHPADTTECHLTGLTYHMKLVGKDRRYFIPLIGLLDGLRSRTDMVDHFDNITGLGAFRDVKATIESAELSPSGSHLAVCIRITTWLGLRVKYAGFIYSINEKSILGKVSSGKREDGVWMMEVIPTRPKSAA